MLQGKNIPGKNILEFTKSQIIFPDSDNNVIFENDNLRHGAYYKLLPPKDDIDRRFKYEITIENDVPIRLIVNKTNEMKLKWIHNLYPFQKNSTAAIILSAISLIISSLLAVLKLTGC